MSKEIGTVYDDGDVIVMEDGTRIEISPEMADELAYMGPGKRDGE